MNAEYEFAIFYNKFISELLQNKHSKEMHQLLLAKKTQSDKELLTLYKTCYNRIYYLKEIIIIELHYILQYLDVIVSVSIYLSIEILTLILKIMKVILLFIVVDR